MRNLCHIYNSPVNLKLFQDNKSKNNKKMLVHSQEGSFQSWPNDIYLRSVFSFLKYFIPANKAPPIANVTAKDFQETGYRVRDFKNKSTSKMPTSNHTKYSIVILNINTQRPLYCSTCRMFHVIWDEEIRKVSVGAVEPGLLTHLQRQVSKGKFTKSISFHLKKMTQSSSTKIVSPCDPDPDGWFKNQLITYLCWYCDYE